MQVRAEDVTVEIAGHPIVKVSSVTAEPGKLLVLAGASGSGKTTLLNALGLLRRVDTGMVLVDGKDSTRWRDGRRRRYWRDHVAFVFQDYGLVEEESVSYNVSIGRRRVVGISRADHERVERVLEHVHLAGREREQTSRLSGGEKQRVGLARAMFRQADMVLADEPTASLDRANRELVLGFLREEAERGAAVVVATHDEDVIAAADEVVVLGR